MMDRKVFVRPLDPREGNEWTEVGVVNSIKLVKYYAVIWCPDCNGVNFYGCFDGGVERLGPFNTYAEAELAGVEFSALSIWKYEIEEVGDESAGAH